MNKTSNNNTRNRQQINTVTVVNTTSKKKTSRTTPPTQMLTIRQIAQTGIIKESSLRALVKNHSIPYISVGKKCLINLPLLIAALDNPQSDIYRKECVSYGT